jgi:anti-sigma regulatory factor (Ser/Thr protein kinase)
MAGPGPLLYVGPHTDRIALECESTPFFELVSAASIEAAVALIRLKAHQLNAALFDADLDSDELEEVVAYLKRSFPEVEVALAGEVDDEELNRLRLLGVTFVVGAIPSQEQLKLLATLATRSGQRKFGDDDWSLKVESGNWVEISVPSKEEYVTRIQELVEMLGRTKLDQDTRDEMLLAIDEFVRNAMEWGNRFDASRRVIVSYFCTADRIMIRVEDQGDGFDTSTFEDPTKDLKAHTEAREAAGKRAGGFGIHMIRNMMDEVLYNETGNVVILTKYLDPSLL